MADSTLDRLAESGSENKGDGRRVSAMKSWQSLAVARTLAAALSIMGLAFAGCRPPYDDVLTDADGDQIRVTLIASIVGDPDLTEAEKREALRAIGIDDENLIDFILSGDTP